MRTDTPGTAPASRPKRSAAPDSTRQTESLLVLFERPGRPTIPGARRGRAANHVLATHTACTTQMPRSCGGPSTSRTAVTRLHAREGEPSRSPRAVCTRSRPSPSTTEGVNTSARLAGLSSEPLENVVVDADGDASRFGGASARGPRFAVRSRKSCFTLPPRGPRRLVQTCVSRWVVRTRTGPEPGHRRDATTGTL